MGEIEIQLFGWEIVATPLIFGFAAVLALGRAFQREREESALDGLLVAPLSRSALFAGKALGVLVFLFAIALVVIPLTALLFSLDLDKYGPGLFLLALAALPGVAASGTLFGAMTVRTAARDLLLAVVLFPLIAPTLLAAVAGTRELLGGASIAMIQGLLVLIVCFIAGFRPEHWSTVPLALLFMALVAIVFAGLGTAIGSTLQNMQGFQLIMNFLVMPIFFLSGALFPLNNIPTALSIATKIDPLAYGIDGLRGAFINASRFSLAACNVFFNDPPAVSTMPSNRCSVLR